MDARHAQRKDQHQHTRIHVYAHHHEHRQQCEHNVQCEHITHHTMWHEQPFQYLYEQLQSLRSRMNNSNQFQMQTALRRGLRPITIQLQDCPSSYTTDMKMHVFICEHDRDTNEPARSTSVPVASSGDNDDQRTACSTSRNSSPMPAAHQDNHAGTPIKEKNTSTINADMQHIDVSPIHQVPPTPIEYVHKPTQRHQSDIKSTPDSTFSLNAETFTEALMSARSQVSFEVKGDGTSVQIPTQPARLQHPDDDSIARFRERFKRYVTRIQEFNERNKTNIRAVVKPLVDLSVWKLLSRRYLHDHHRTKRNEKTNDQAVLDYIMRKGEYANTGRDKPFVRDPLKALRDIPWPITGKTLEQRLAAYITKWDEIIDELGETLLQEKR